MATNTKTDDTTSVISYLDKNLRSLVYNPSLNSLIYLNDKQELVIRSADQLSKVLYRTIPLSNVDESYDVIPNHDKIIFLTSTHVYVRQLYQGLYFLDSIISSINDDHSQVLIELTYGDAQLLIQLLKTLDLAALNHIAEFHNLLQEKLDSHTNSSSSWQLIQINYDCINAIKICFDILRIHKQNVDSSSGSSSKLPGIVVIGLLLDYLTRYYHHRRSLSSIADEQIGSTLDSTSTTNNNLTSNSSVSTGSHLNNVRPSKERLMFSEATRYRSFTLWPHTSFRWLSPVGYFHV